jgi:Uma2 family endonuclease
MADPVDKRKPATYQDVLDAPEHMIAEIIAGELHLSPRPGQRHTRVASVLGTVLGPPFDEGNGGPGGWLLLGEPELHLADDVLVPDLAGWRRERMPDLGDDAYITVVPDWICEVLSRSTEARDRTEKLAIYAREGVRHVWLIHPLYRTVEVYRLHDGAWLSVAVYTGDEVVRAEPFDALELDLARLWRDLLPARPRGSRASEAEPEYF